MVRLKGNKGHVVEDAEAETSSHEKQYPIHNPVIRMRFLSISCLLWWLCNKAAANFIILDEFSSESGGRAYTHR